ncbi:MAG: ABC transporter permease subunit [Actinomycetota bacterium]|nr:ABC transporter permease subunit [Actinomycetota bacterium]
MATAEAQAGVKSAAGKPAKIERPPGGGRSWSGFLFLLPALLALGAFVLYPSIDTFAQSFQADDTRAFVGLENYQAIAESARIRTAVINTAIWVVIAPVLITGLGLIVAVLTERVSYAGAIKTILFMPMAISALAVGVIWRGVYDPDPAIGLANAALGNVAEAVDEPGRYPDATIPPEGSLIKEKDGSLTTKETFGAGEVGLIGVVGIPEPAGAVEASPSAEVGEGDAAVLVWRDFSPEGGKTGQVDPNELALGDATIALLDENGQELETSTTDENGVATFRGVGDGPFKASMTPANFDRGYTGVDWLGASEVTPFGYPHLVTLAIIFAFVWMQLGFAIVVIGSGLSALPRDLLEAARVDGATEGQVFRHITFPLLKPVLIVVFVTLTINVLKIFDIVYVLAPNAVQNEANVIALEMWKSSFAARQFGVGAAVAVLLFLLVIPIMVFNLRRFRRESA